MGHPKKHRWTVDGLGLMVKMGSMIALFTSIALALTPSSPLPAELQDPSANQMALAVDAPNIVLMFVDDMGYGDLSCTGHPTIRTPHLDLLAQQGVRMTQFVVACSVCTPSRAALLTGCYPRRIGMHEHVIFPNDKWGLNPEEVTLAEVLKERGYATACFGKWHLGHSMGLLPLSQGFDEFVGIPYSNDMSQIHRPKRDTYQYRLPFFQGNEVVEWEPNQAQFTQRFTDETVRFIEEHKDEPFFVYLPHPMPHVPLYRSAAFQDRSPRGIYGDVIEELDHSMGRIVATLERLGLREKTLIIFTSDNGPSTSRRLSGGSPGPFRGGKGSTLEGGHRVPFIASWPGHIPEGRVNHEFMTSMDVLPTLAGFTGKPFVATKPIDGKDVGSLLLCEPGAKSPTRAFLYYGKKGPLEAIRWGPWKLRLEQGTLFNLEEDPSELYNLAIRLPDRLDSLRDLATRLDQRLVQEARPRANGGSTIFQPGKPQSQSGPSSEAAPATQATIQDY